MATYTALRLPGGPHDDCVVVLRNEVGFTVATYALPHGAGLYSAALEALSKNGDRVLGIDEKGAKAYLAGSLGDIL